MIGLNTSAFIEAAIVGRPVHTIVVPEFAERQEGTVHFHYLKSVGGGVFRLARISTNIAQLATSLREPIPENLHAGFVALSSAPSVSTGLPRTFSEAILDLGRSPTAAPGRAPLWAPALQLLLRPLALAAHVAVARIENRTIEPFSSCSERAADDYRRQRDAGGSASRGP